MLVTVTNEPKRIDMTPAVIGSKPGRTGGILTSLERKGFIRQLLQVFHSSPVAARSSREPETG